MTWSLANELGAPTVAALLEPASKYEIPDEERAMSRATAEAVIHAALWAYGVRSSSFASCYAFDNLYTALGIQDLNREDPKRLRWLADQIDGFGDVDIHERATTFAAAYKREEPIDQDYIAAVRNAIDAAMHLPKQHKPEPSK